MNSDSSILRHLFISPQHNFVGHQGREPDDFPVIDAGTVECRKGRGLVGDRYYDHKPDYKGQVTFLAWETFAEMRRLFELPKLQPSAFRRNLITFELDLNALIGVEFDIQGVRFLGTEEARPCHWMERVVGIGAKAALEGSGGLRARILSDGFLQPGPCCLKLFDAVRQDCA